MGETSVLRSTQDARAVAQQLLASFAEARPLITSDVIEALRQMVDEVKHQDPAQALQIAQTAMAAAALIADPSAHAAAARAKATAHVFLFELPAALEHYRQAEQIYRQLGALQQQVSVLSPQVYVLNALGDPAAALHLADEVRPLCHALGQVGLASLVNLEMNVGTVHIQAGRYEASLAACDRATAAAEALGDQAALGRIEINRANVYQELDRYSEAEHCYQRARQILVASNQNRQQVALVDLNLGLLAMRRAEFWQGLQHLEQARTGYLSTTHLAWVDFNRALVYHRLNLNAETLQLAAAAVDALNHSGSQREVAMALQVWASAAEKSGASSEAEQLLQRARWLFSELGAAVMVAQVDLALAQIALHGKQFDSAHLHLTTLRNFSDLSRIPSLAIQTDLLDAELQLQAAEPDFTSILHLLDHAIVLIPEDVQNHLRLEAYRLKAQTLARLDDIPAARAAYAVAIQAAIDIRLTLLLDEFQIAFLEEQLPLFWEAAALSLRAGEELEEVAQILALATTTPEQHQGVTTDALSSDDLAELQRLRNDWHWQQSKVETLTSTAPLQNNGELVNTQKALGQLEVQIADRWRRLGTRTPLSQPPDITTSPKSQTRLFTWSAKDYAQQLQHALEQGKESGKAAYLHYFIMGQQLSILVGRPDSLRCYSLGATNGIDSALRAWRHHLRDWALIDSQPELARQLAARPLTLLRRLLIEPLLASIADCDHLYLILPPQWSDLPIAALLDRGSALIERWSVTQLLSPFSLLAPHTGRDRRNLTQPKDRHALLVGIAEMAGLNQTRSELHRIAELAPQPWQWQLLLDEQATHEQLLSQMVGCDLLHIASHATFRADNPLFSWLQLADGRLSVAELYHRVRLQRRPLTVLSACETARGQHSGLLGVARALLAVGAGELIATQWKVEDRASAELMSEFYQHWFATSEVAHFRAATALAKAQRKVANTLHPAYWAGFVNIK
ncbi:MAG: CHAT domain-containing protein [Caldilineaceae bacterium]